MLYSTGVSYLQFVYRKFSKVFPKLAGEILQCEDIDGIYIPDVYLYGTIEKRFMLTVMMCFLIRIGRRVVYVPDCQALMAKDFLGYLIKSFLLAFATEPEIIKQIKRAGSYKDFLEFCQRFEYEGLEDKVYFIIDQDNAFDPEDGIGNLIPDLKKSNAENSWGIIGG